MKITDILTVDSNRKSASYIGTAADIEVVQIVRDEVKAANALIRKVGGTQLKLTPRGRFGKGNAKGKSTMHVPYADAARFDLYLTQKV